MSLAAVFLYVNPSAISRVVQIIGIWEFLIFFRVIPDNLFPLLGYWNGSSPRQVLNAKIALSDEEANEPEELEKAAPFWKYRIVGLAGVLIIGVLLITLLTVMGVAWNLIKLHFK